MAAVSKLYWAIHPLFPPSAQGQTGLLQEFIGTVTWGANAETYTTGGVAVAANDLRVSALSTIEHFVCEDGGMEGTTRKANVCALDRENSKLMMYNLARTEVSNGSDIGAFKFYVRFVARNVQDA